MIPVIFTRHLAIGLDDMFQYDMLARSLASGNGFRWYAPADLARIAPFLHLNPAVLVPDPRGLLTTFRAPLYPAFLAIIYFFNGINDGRFLAARLAQTVIGALLAPLTYWVAHQLLPLSAAGQYEAGERADRAPRMAAWIIAVYPMLLIFPIALATENLFFLLVLLSVYSLLKLAGIAASSNHRPSVIHFLFPGFLLGLAALTRSVILPFAGLAILWIWFSLGQRRGAMLTALVLLLTIVPWVVRNSLLTGKLTGIETSMGYNLYVGYHPQSTGTFAFGPSLDLLSIIDDKVRDEIGTQKAIEFIRQDPARFPYLAMRRLGYFFNLETRAFTYFYVNDFLGYIPPALLAIILLVLTLPFVFVSISALFGAASLPWQPPVLLMALLFTGYLLPHIFILSEERFHLTLLPFFAIFSAVFWTGGSSAIALIRKPVLYVCIFLALLLLTNWGFELARDGHTILQMLGPNGNRLYLPY